MIIAMTNHPSFTRSICMADVVDCCEESDAVDSYYVMEPNQISITWCDGENEIINNCNEALNAISAMEAN